MCLIQTVTVWLSLGVCSCDANMPTSVGEVIQTLAVNKPS